MNTTDIIGLRKPWAWVQPKDRAELIQRLFEAREYAVPERERENLCSMAYVALSRETVSDTRDTVLEEAAVALELLWPNSNKTMIGATVIRALKKAALQEPVQPPSGIEGGRGPSPVGAAPCVVGTPNEKLASLCRDHAYYMDTYNDHFVGSTKAIARCLYEAADALSAQVPAPDFVCLKEPRCKSPCGEKGCHVAQVPAEKTP